MKRLVVVLSSLLVLPAFAEVVPSSYDQDLLFYDMETDDTIANDTPAEVKPVAKQSGAQRMAPGRTTGTTGRGVATSSNRQGRGVATSRPGATQSRTIATRGTTATTTRTAQPVARRTAAGAAQNTASGRVATRPSGTKARASVVTSTAPLYNAVQSRSNTGRASITTRGATVRTATVSNQVKPTADSALETTSEMDTLKSLTEYCQAQYTSCMDNYCNVLDDNQGRCTCSKNIANYQKTEDALQSATDALQDVARSIQYIGLSKDQITTLFTETEAELTMKGTQDTSTLRSSLDKVKKMIVDVKGGTSTSVTEDSGLAFDLDGLLNFDMDNVGFDLSMFMQTNSSNTNSISNQRGESLYRTASSRCKASVLNSCTAQGVDAAVVTNAYDLEIDKSCLAYERSLTDANKQMATTVANAREVLKKARLMVAQSKNSYDLRGCVSALETCMQDDYVCGSGYENCLDPSGQYIVNGSVVIGSMPGNNTDSAANDGIGQITSNYSNENLFQTWKSTKTEAKSPWTPLTTANTGFSAPANAAGTGTDPKNTAVSKSNYPYITLYDYIDKTVTNDAAKKSSDKMSEFLQYKIGYHDDSTRKDYGMCMSVLNKCQNYTYTTDKKGNPTYNPQNEVIKQFLQRALVTIKMSQDEILSSYAEECINDVSSCLTTNGFDFENPANTKSRSAINACYARIKTCLSVNGNIYGSVQPDVVNHWVLATFYENPDYTLVTSDIDVDIACANLTTQEACANFEARCILHSSGTTTSSSGTTTSSSETTTSSSGTTTSSSTVSIETNRKFCEWSTSKNKCVRQDAQHCNE